MPYYIVDTGYCPKIYIASNDQEFMNYFINDLDHFQDIFCSMNLTDSKLKEKIPNVFDNKSIDLYDVDDFDKCKDEIRDELTDLTFTDFVNLLKGECNDGNATPYIVIKKIKKSDVINCSNA